VSGLLLTYVLSVSAPDRDACEARATQAVEVLLRVGARVKATDAARAVPLHAAARTGRAPLFDRLLAAGGDATAADANGVTVLHAAALGGSWALAARVLDLGGDVRAVSADGQTVMHCATLGAHCQRVADPPSACRGSIALPLHATLAGHHGYVFLKSSASM